MTMTEALPHETGDRLRKSQEKLARYLDRSLRPQAFRYDPVRIKNLEKVAGGPNQLVPDAGQTVEHRVAAGPLGHRAGGARR